MKKIAAIIGLIMIGLLGHWIYINQNGNYLNASLSTTDIVSNQNKDSNSPKLEDEKKFTFILGGDMMFDRMVDYKFRGDKLVQVVENLGENFFAGYDLSIINLEGPISDKDIEPDIRANNLVFNFPPKTLDVLKWLGIKSVSLANNHTLNNGTKGFNHTKEILTVNGITPIGKQNEFNKDSIAHFQNTNYKVAVMAINLLETNSDIGEYIKDEKQNGYFVIIFPHWGNEYQTKHSTSQQKTAHTWIDAGADLIIGSHPHVIQDAEMYKNKPIFYSLGNFLFDQTFSSETQRGLIIAGEITEDELKFKLLPTISKNLKPELLTGKEKDELISTLNKQLNIESSNPDNNYDIIVDREE